MDVRLLDRAKAFVETSQSRWPSIPVVQLATFAINTLQPLPESNSQSQIPLLVFLFTVPRLYRLLTGLPKHTRNRCFYTFQPFESDEGEKSLKYELVRLSEKSLST